MKFFKLFIVVGFMVGSFTACGTGVGTTEGSTGTAGLSLQLKEDATRLTQDGYQVSFTTFAVALSNVSLGNASHSMTATGSFAADFADEEITDVVEIEDMPAGEYDQVTLTLGTGSSLTGTQALQIPNLQKATTGSGVTESLNGLSILIVGTATKNNTTCNLRIEIAQEGTEITVANPESNDIDIEAGSESEILVEIDPDHILGVINLSNSCTNTDTSVSFSESVNANDTDAIFDEFKEALALESTAGHAHAHAYK